tara:strand:- start:22883 stop:23752 length:870 start_codon:yes stop_codon:yes gene_type:complete
MNHEDNLTTVERIENAKAKFPLLNEMIVERGTAEDWHSLHHLHYKTEGKPFGPAYYRLSLHGELVGVCVLTMPKGLLKERHKVMPEIKPGGNSRMANTARYNMINANFRVVGRIVLDTMFRGVGASYRFQNLVARQSGYRFVEIQSAMSKYNMFSEKAGFRSAKLMRSNKYEKGVKFFRSTFEAHPADSGAIMAELNALRPAVAKARIQEMRKFYYANSAQEKTGNARKNGTSRVDAMEVEELLRNLQQLVLASPVYSVYVNPDAGRELPDKLPLSSFDNQLPTERLII